MYGIDLMKKGAPEQRKNWCRQNDYAIRMLINNAGVGNSGPFESLAAEFYYNQMQLNIVALYQIYFKMR